MSTRCQIGFYEKQDKNIMTGWQALIYRHSDGYPGDIDKEEGGVLLDILPKLSKSTRKHDPEYHAARLLQALCNDYDAWQADYEKEHPQYGRDADGYYRGYGISKSFHTDIDYFYAVYPERVEVHEPIFNEDGEIVNMKLLFAVDYLGKKIEAKSL